MHDDVPLGEDLVDGKAGKAERFRQLNGKPGRADRSDPRLEEAIGDHASSDGGHFKIVRSDRARRQLFLIALERGFLDSILDRVVVDPFTRLAGLMTRFDQWLCDVVLTVRLPAAIDGGDQDE